MKNKAVKNIKYPQEYEYWESYMWRKAKKWSIIFQRLERWENIKQAIRPEKHTTRKITHEAQECAKCWGYKLNKHFSKNIRAKNWLMNKCKECMKKIKLKYRAKLRVREMERNYKKEFRKTDIWKFRTKLDNLYYTNPIIKKNREILKNVGSKFLTREESLKSKLSFLISKWFSEEFLEKIYNKNKIF